MITEILDPITNEKLEIYGCDERTGEVYECNIPKIVASVCLYFAYDETEATRMLANSDIDNPITIDHETFWAE